MNGPITGSEIFIRISKPQGKHKCPNPKCGQRFNQYRVTKKSNYIQLRCKICNYLIKQVVLDDPA